MDHVCTDFDPTLAERSAVLTIQPRVMVTTSCGKARATDKSSPAMVISSQATDCSATRSTEPPPTSGARITAVLVTVLKHTVLAPVALSAPLVPLTFRTQASRASTTTS